MDTCLDPTSNMRAGMCSEGMQVHNDNRHSLLSLKTQGACYIHVQGIPVAIFQCLRLRLHQKPSLVCLCNDTAGSDE